MKGAAMKSEDFLTLVRGFVDAWNRHDSDALAAFYAEDAVRYRCGERLGGRNKKEIRRDLQSLFKAFPDLTIAYQHQFTSGTHGVLQWTVRGTQTGPFETSIGAIPATGKWVEFTGVTLWELDDSGLILRERVYPDRLGLLQQLDAIRVAVPV